MTTPPGWYPDPGQIPHHPPQERWWDGNAWTDNQRPAAGFSAAPPPPPPGAGRGPLIAGIVGGVVLLAALGVGAVLLVGADDDSGSEAKPPGSAAPREPESEEPPTEEPPSEDPEQPGVPTAPPDGERVLPATGVRLPVLNGWKESEGSHGASVGIGTYKCPGDKHERCLRGGSSILVTPDDGAVKDVAESDVKKNAAQAYNPDTYGGITSHKVLKKGKVKVAGQDGYRVRWRIENKTEPDAYVESVAFEHPDGSGKMLVVRSGFDIHKDAPPVSDMDKLVDGVSRGSSDEDGTTEHV